MNPLQHNEYILNMNSLRHLVENFSSEMNNISKGRNDLEQDLVLHVPTYIIILTGTLIT